MCALHATLLRLRVKARSAVDAIAVSQCESWHVQLGSTFDKRLGLRSAGQKAEGAGGVKLNVFGGHKDDRLQMTVNSSQLCFYNYQLVVKSF